MYRAAVFLAFVALSAATCLTVYDSGVSLTDQSTIVNRHNYLRTQPAQGLLPNQPKASNMLRMKWDTALAASAQNIANTCVYGHVKVNDNRFAVGQNLYTSWSSALSKGANWTAGIQAWFDEYKTYTFGTTTYNHYTQVVWANTYLVGCGYKQYMNDKGMYQQLYVCNYGPAGNYIGQTPYQVGPGCENLC